MNKKIETTRPELYPVPVKSPWHHLGMDFVGPISPVSRSGNRYILTISDYFTKFGWAKALPSKEAVNVVCALREVRHNEIFQDLIDKLIIISFPSYLAVLHYGSPISHDDRPG